MDNPAFAAADPKVLDAIFAEARAEIANQHDPEVLHFAPWGSPLTSCGLPAPRRQDITDRRKATTCEDCRSRFA